MRQLISNTCKNGRVITVVVIDRVDDAVPLASCLVENGLLNVEVTLRTEDALYAIEAIARAIPDCVVGVGSILYPEQLQQAQDAGGAFGVSPGTSPKLRQALSETDWPFLPGAGTLSEILSLREAGFKEQKLFPAESIGGVGLINAVSGPVSDVSFCPTGGVKLENASKYLALSNVFAVGGTWIAPPNLIRDNAWDQIGRNAKLASTVSAKTVLV